MNQIGNVPGGDQLGQILQQMGLGMQGTSSTQGGTGIQSTRVEKKPDQNKDSISEYEGGDRGSYTLPGAGSPMPPPPNPSILASWQGGETTTKAVLATLKPPAEVTVAGPVKIESEFGIKLATSQSYARFGILVMGEKTFLAKLEAFFKASGEPLPQDTASPAFKSAIYEVMQNYLKESGTILPQVLNEQLAGGMDILKGIDTYLEYLTGVSPAGKSVLEPAGMQTPINIASGYIEIAEELVATLEKAGPFNEKVPVLNFLKLMAETIQMVRQVMLECQLEETSKAQDKMLAKKDAMDVRMKYMEDKFKEQLKMFEMQRVMDVLGDFMRIFMYCVQAVILLVAVFFLPFAPIMTLLVFAVQLGMLAITVALTESGAMEKMFDGINDIVTSVTSSIGGLSDDVGKLIFWLAVIVVILVICLVLTLAPGVGAVVPAIIGSVIGWIAQYSGIMETIGDWLTDVVGWKDDLAKGVMKGLASFIFSLITGIILALIGIVRQIVEQVIKMAYSLIIQIITMVVTFVIQLISMILKIVIQIVQMIVTGSMKSIIDMIKQVVNLVIEGLKLIMQLLKQGLSLLMELIKTMVGLVIDVLKIFLQIIEELIVTIVKMVLEIVKKVFTAMVDAIISVIKSVLELFKTLVEGIKSLIEQLVKAATEMLKQVVQQGMQIVSTLAQAGFRMGMAQLELLQGQIDGVVSVFDDLIRLMSQDLEKTISQNATEGLGEFSELCVELTKFFAQVIGNYSGIASGIAGAA